jgi:hypothetical protein
MPDPLDALRLPVVPVGPRPAFAAALLRRIEGGGAPASGRAATVRYFVTDLDAAVAFYRDPLEFEEELRPSPAFAMLYRGDLRLLLSVPGGGVGGGAPMPDDTLPAPGAGTGSPCRSRTSPLPSTSCAPRAPGSATRSSPAWASGRSCSPIRPATWSSCSSRSPPTTSGHRARPVSPGAGKLVR